MIVMAHFATKGSQVIESSELFWSSGHNRCGEVNDEGLIWHELSVEFNKPFNFLSPGIVNIK